MENNEQQSNHHRRPRGPRKPKTNSNTTTSTTTTTPLTSPPPLVAPISAQPLPQSSNPTAAVTAVAATSPKRRRPRRRTNRNPANTSDATETTPTTADHSAAEVKLPPTTPPPPPPETSSVSSTMPPAPGPTQLSKEQVLAEREAKRVAKLAAKHKIVDAGRNLSADNPAPIAVATAATIPAAKSIGSETAAATNAQSAAGDEKSRDVVMAEREAKKLAKLAAKNKNKQQPTESVAAPAVAAAVGVAVPRVEPVQDATNGPQLVEQLDQLRIVDDSAAKQADAKPTLSKAERRAKQEAQRAAKAAAQAAVKQPAAAAKTTATAGASNAKSPAAAAKKSPAGVAPVATSSLHRVKLFNHLYPSDRVAVALDAADAIELHAAVIKLGTQYSNRVVVGSNARCIAFLNTMKMVINDYKTPAQKEFTRGLEAAIQQSVQYLHQCRPLSVSVQNALKHIKWQITQLRDNAATAATAAAVAATADVSEAEQRVHLLDSVDTYLRDQVEKAAQAISISVQQKISNGDVILTFGCSSLVSHLLQEAQKREVDFRVVVVDARPDHEGQEMLRRLVALGVRCTCVLVNAIGFIMPVVTKVLLGAHALLANGYVMSRAGTAQVALMARAHNVPVLVCCETHKFSERVQTDAFVYNEIGRPDDLVLRPTVKSTRLGAAGAASALANWRQVPQLTPLNLCYDITPPELVTAVVTELAILPCTSVPVILRMQPS